MNCNSEKEQVAVSVGNNDYVTCEQCQEYRDKLLIADQEQNLTLIKLDTEMSFVKKIMWSILGVLISGFAGTIFAVLSLG